MQTDEKKVSQAPTVSLLQLTNKSKLFLSVSIGLNKDCWNLTLFEKHETKCEVMVSHSFTLPSRSLYSLGRDVQFRGKFALLVMSIHHLHLLAVVLQYVLCVMGPDYYGASAAPVGKDTCFNSM